MAAISHGDYTPGRPPNIVFVLTDDQGYGDLGCHGNPIVQTPHIDRFRQESVRLTNFHVGPTCAPTRAILLTGHYANSTGVWHTIGGRSLLRENEWTLAQAVAERGYRTGIFGKWHLGDAYPYRPQDRGFQEVIVHGGGGIGQTPDYWGNDYFDDTYFVNGQPTPHAGYCTDVWFGAALHFIETHKDRPFFCYIATNAPHSPFNVPQHYYERYRGRVPDARARFYGMISCIDDNFGLLRTKLREWGIAENTILIFMTDNGSSAGATLDRNGYVVDGYNAGMRGMKGSPYEGGHRVPFFISWPAGGLAGGSAVDRLAASVDFMPTLLDLCGVHVPAERTFHGQSVAPLLRGQVAGWADRIIVTDSQRLANPVKWRQSAVMTERWRLVKGKELYDVQADPEQRRDVAGDWPDVVSWLQNGYETWWEIVSRQFSEEIPIAIGAEAGVWTRLTAHDWRNEACECPWHQGHIRAGLAANGYWEIAIRAEGDYTIELRRWPREAGRALAAGIAGDDVVWNRAGVEPRCADYYTGGTALPIREARLQIGQFASRQEVGTGDVAARFRARLQPGPAHLTTWLSDGQSFEVGAYYVDIRREI